MKKVINVKLAPGGRATIHASNVTFELYGVFAVDKPENTPEGAKEYDVDEEGNMTLRSEEALS